MPMFTMSRVRLVKLNNFHETILESNMACNREITMSPCVVCMRNATPQHQQEHTALLGVWLAR